MLPRSYLYDLGLRGNNFRQFRVHERSRLRTGGEVRAKHATGRSRQSDAAKQTIGPWSNGVRIGRGVDAAIAKTAA